MNASIKWRIRMPSLSYTTGLIYTLIVMAGPGLGFAEMTPFDWALIHLDYARQEKVQQLGSFCTRIHALAQKAAQDEFVLASFDINCQYDRARTQGVPPTDLTDQVTRLRQSFNHYYIQNYFAFYDILFVNDRGRIFYTIRNESDLSQTALENQQTQCALLSTLATHPQQEVFVDFHYYAPSAEAAAFFVEPVREEDQITGWIVLQCAINKVNSIFAWTDDLGTTGETLLVNRQGTMLTESNFIGRSTILNKRLDDRNIQAKFADRQGHRTVTDYRGQTAWTSFEVVEFLDTPWLVVAKMDQDEILTQHYLQHRRYYGDQIKSYLHHTPVTPLCRKDIPFNEAMLRIDMDEFLKADNGERLVTFGLATCTGLLASYPKRFAYLAHISPKDKIYGVTSETNLLGQMVKRLNTFDIHPVEKRDMEFTVVATHDESLLAIVDKLLEEGYLLSQIQVLVNMEAQSASISYDYQQDELAVGWRTQENVDDNSRHDKEDRSNLGELLQSLMDIPHYPLAQRSCLQTHIDSGIKKAG